MTDSPTPTPDPTPSSLVSDPTPSVVLEKPENPTPETPKPTDAPKVEPLTAEAIVAPEGFTLDTDFAPKFVTLANELGITAEGANKLVALQAELSKKGSEAATQVWEETQQKWQDEVKADPVVGGQNLEPALAGIATLIDTYVPDEAGRTALRQAFALTGAGNNPHVIRFLHAVAKERNEPGHVSGRPAEAAPRDAASTLYPNQGKS